jgi:hypothetical protein
LIGPGQYIENIKAGVKPMASVPSFPRILPAYILEIADSRKLLKARRADSELLSFPALPILKLNPANGIIVILLCYVSVTED